MALIDRRPCPHHGYHVNHYNGICMECENERIALEKTNADAYWNSLSIDEKLNYLRSKIE